MTILFSSDRECSECRCIEYIQRISDLECKLRDAELEIKLLRGQIRPMSSSILLPRFFATDPPAPEPEDEGHYEFF